VDETRASRAGASGLAEGFVTRPKGSKKGEKGKKGKKHFAFFALLAFLASFLVLIAQIEIFCIPPITSSRSYIVGRN
jgi:hypothetical protein